MPDEKNGKEQWFSNKDLFLMVQELRGELKETREIVKKYNGIRSDMNWCVEQLQKHKITKDTRYNLLSAVREWGGWIVALGILLVKIFG